MALLPQLLYKVYFGALAIDVPGTSLIGLLQSRRDAGLNEFFAVDAGNTAARKSLLWAAPVSFGAPVFRIDGISLSGGFSQLGTYPVLDDKGNAVQYQLWKSNQVGLGNTTFMVSQA